MGAGAHFCTEECNSILLTEVLHHLSWNGFIESLVEYFPLKHSKQHCCNLSCQPTVSRCCICRWRYIAEGFMEYALWCLAVLHGGRVDVQLLQHHRKLMLEWAVLGQAELYISLQLGFRTIERKGLFTCVLQPARRMHTFWSETLYGSVSGFHNRHLLLLPHRE